MLSSDSLDGNDLLLALAAAVYPQLLAVVVLILTRANPRPLLWPCYLGSLSVSVAGGIAIFAVFRSRGSIAGASSHRLRPATYLVFGAIAVALASLVASRPGRQLMGRDFRLARRKPRNPPRSKTVSRMKSRAEEALGEGSLVVAGVVGRYSLYRARLTFSRSVTSREAITRRSRPARSSSRLR